MLGYEPFIDTLLLVPAQDFVHDINLPTGATVPDGTTADLIIYDQTWTQQATWPADITSNSISWTISSTVSDTITTPANYRIYVHYSDGTDLCWYRGTVSLQE